MVMYMHNYYALTLCKPPLVLVLKRENVIFHTTQTLPGLWLVVVDTDSSMGASSGLHILLGQ